MAKRRKKCTVTIWPTRVATWRDRDRDIMRGTRYPGFPGLVYDSKMQGPRAEISCYKAFLQQKREAKQTGHLQAFLSCPTEGPWRITSGMGDYTFSSDVNRTTGSWESNWGDGRRAVRFKMGEEVWAGTVFLGAPFTSCEADPTGHDQCFRWDPVTQTSHYVAGRKTKSYAYGDCPGGDGLFGVFHRTYLKSTGWYSGRNYAREYKQRPREWLKAHWAATARERKEERQKERVYWRDYGQKRIP